MISDNTFGQAYWLRCSSIRLRSNGSQHHGGGGSKSGDPLAFALQRGFIENGIFLRDTRNILRAEVFYTMTLVFYDLGVEAFGTLDCCTW